MSNHIHIGDIVYLETDKYVCVDKLNDKFKVVLFGNRGVSFWVFASEVWK